MDRQVSDLEDRFEDGGSLWLARLDSNTQCIRNGLSRGKHSRHHNWPAGGEGPISCTPSPRGPRCGLVNSRVQLMDLTEAVLQEPVGFELVTLAPSECVVCGAPCREGSDRANRLVFATGVGLDV